jgi:hypothetical protein
VTLFNLSKDSYNTNLPGGTDTTSIIYPDIKDTLSLPFLARYVMQYIKGGMRNCLKRGGVVSFGAWSIRLIQVI